MIYGYVNESILLPQVTTEMLSDVKFLRQFLLPESQSSPKLFVRYENVREQLIHLDEDKQALKGIDEVCGLQSVDHVENQLFVNTKAGDTVVTSTLMNFSRYLDQALKVVRFFFEKKVRVISILEKFDSFVEDTLMKSNVYIEFQKNRAEEARNMRKEGGKNKENMKAGRKAKTVEDYPLFASYYGQWKDHIINKAEFAEKLSVSRPTLDKLINEFVVKGYEN